MNDNPSTNESTGELPRQQFLPENPRGNICDVVGCGGYPGEGVWHCQRPGCDHYVHQFCSIELVDSREGILFCSSHCKPNDSNETIYNHVISSLQPGAEFSTFEELQAVIRDDGAKYGVKINQRQTHLMDDRALVIFGHKSIQRGVFYCSQLHCPYTMRFSYNFTKMKYTIRSNSFHGLHNHGVKNTLHARGKGIPFDKEFIVLEILPDGIDRFQCRHCRTIVLKKVNRLAHLKDCDTYRTQLGLQPDDNEPSNQNEVEISGGQKNISTEFRYVPSDGKTSSRLECKHCGIHLNPKSNRLLTHLRDCASYQGFQEPPGIATSSTLMDSSDGLRSIQLPTTSTALLPSQLECRQLDSDTDFANVAALRATTGLTQIMDEVFNDTRVSHWGLYDIAPPTKRSRTTFQAQASLSLVAHFTITNLECNIFGVKTPIGGLGNITTDFTKPNLNKAILLHFLRECTQRRLAFGIVPSSPSTDTLCRLLGFTPLSPWIEHTFASTALPTDSYPHHLLDHISLDTDGDEILECHTRYAATHHGTIYKNAADILRSDSRLLGCRDLRGILRGYIQYTIHIQERRMIIHELVYEDHRILTGLLGCLGKQSHASTITLQTADPHFKSLLIHPPQISKYIHQLDLMLRVIHLNELFSHHFSNRNFNYVTGLNFHLIVMDKLQIQSIDLNFENGYVHVINNKTPPYELNVQLDIDSLTSLVFGIIPFTKLIHYGKITITPFDPRTIRLLSRLFDVDVFPTILWTGMNCL